MKENGIYGHVASKGREEERNI